MDAAVAPAQRAIDLASEAPFRVGRARVDPASRDATFGSQSERLQPQNLKVLIALVRGHGTVVSRDDLIDLCWDGRFVGDDVINRSISLLRQFAERAGDFAIETIPRAGYRLLEKSQSRKRRLQIIGATTAAVLALSATASVEWSHRASARPMPTIAVLPFTTSSADALEREVASHARDAVTYALTKTEFLVRVADTAVHRNRPDAEFIVSSNVSSGPKNVVATVRVEDTVHDVIVYSQVFKADRANVANLPDEIGAQIAGSIGWTASLLVLEKSQPSDPAITAELFSPSCIYPKVRRIAEKAPNSAIAQIALGFNVVDVLWDLPRNQRAEVAEVGRRAMNRVRTLAPAFGGNEILWCGLHSRARMIECEDHLRAGLRREPDSPRIGNMLADRLKDVGRTNEALQLARNSLAHDPFRPEKIGLALRMLEATGQQNEAEQLYRDAQRGWPDDIVIFWDRFYGILDRGDFQAIAHFQKDAPPSLSPAIEPMLPVLAASRAKNGGETRKLCPLAQAPSAKRDVCMLAFIRLGDKDDAFALASRIYPKRVGQSLVEEESLWLDSSRYGDTDILMGPAAAQLRSDPRFLELARGLGALAYWRSGRLPDFCDGPRPERICAQLRKN